MRIDKNDVPVRMEVPGAVARLRTDFGDATGYGAMSAEFFSLGAGTDIAPLLQGLKNDHCQAPHWGYLAKGVVVVTYTNGTTDKVKAGDLYYWPPGHSVRVEEDAELLMFSPQHEHIEVIDHMKAKLGG
jgi:hypothetical protein